MEIDLITISEAGDKDFLRVHKNDSLYNLVKVLRKNDADRAVVYGERGAEGMVTLKDIVSKVGSSRSARMPISTLHVSSAMSYPLIKLPYDTSVAKAARVMLENNISSVPAEREGEVVALFSKWDIARLLRGDSTPVTEIMTSSVTRVSETDSLIMVRRLMIDNGFSTLPVVNPSSGEVVGIITLTELVNTLVDIINEFADSGDKDFLKRVRVGDIMRPLVPAVSPSESVGKVAELMVGKNIRGVLIMEENRIKGIVTLTDLTRYVTLKLVTL